eukprot:8222546-Pyramimonas_sp.AAC.1
MANRTGRHNPTWARQTSLRNVRVNACQPKKPSRLPIPRCKRTSDKHELALGHPSPSFPEPTSILYL